MVCACGGMCIWAEEVPQKPEEAAGCPGTEVTGSWEPSDMGARNRTCALQKSYLYA